MAKIVNAFHHYVRGFILRENNWHAHRHLFMGTHAFMNSNATTEYGSSAVSRWGAVAMVTAPGVYPHWQGIGSGAGPSRDRGECGCGEGHRL